MARSRRRSAAVQTRRKSKGLPKADWVYRQCAINPTTGAQIDTVGTYDDFFFAALPGTNNAQSHVLYDSQAYIGVLGAGGVATPAGTPQRVLNRAARAEGRRATILATQGHIDVLPTEWDAGASILLGARIGAFEQDLGFGVFSLDAFYSMWNTNPVTPFESTAMWANYRRLNRREWRWTWNFSTDMVAPVFKAFINWRGRARLDPQECWGLYTELDPVLTTASLEIRYWLRSLVVDES